MDVTKPYKFISFGAMDVTKPFKFIRFAPMDPTFTRFGPYEFIGPWMPPILLNLFALGPWMLPNPISFICFGATYVQSL